eukprot:9457476-Lingulodinium_polyedra.AAC.1
MAVPCPWDRRGRRGRPAAHHQRGRVLSRGRARSISRCSVVRAPRYLRRRQHGGAAVAEEPPRAKRAGP